ncbi:MAG: FxSxx-COOH system tetratricopeptide repeat protein [Nocardioides sp.]
MDETLELDLHHVVRRGVWASFPVLDGLRCWQPFLDAGGSEDVARGSKILTELLRLVLDDWKNTSPRDAEAAARLLDLGSHRGRRVLNGPSGLRIRAGAVYDVSWDQFRRRYESGLIEEFAGYLATWSASRTVGSPPMEPITNLTFDTARTAGSRAVSPQGGPTTDISSTWVWNIIPPVRGFLGRDREIGQIERSLRGQSERGLDLAAVGVHGIAGVGKTQLALAFADRHRARYRLGWWISAETQLDITAGLSRLAVRLGASEDWSSAEFLLFLAERLRAHEPWLIVFDNATLPVDIEPFMPGPGSGRGHILLTSRNPSWRLLAEPVAVDVLGIADATHLLGRSSDADAGAEALAHELGQLPLAISQAAAYAADTRISFTEYLALFRQERARLLDRGLAMAYPGNVSASVTLALGRLASDSAIALRLLEICALCSPDGLPLRRMLTAMLDADGEVERGSGALEQLDVLRALRQSGLLTVDEDDVARLHRLTQVIIEDRIDERRERVADAVGLLARLFPVRPSEPATWDFCGQLVPHARVVFRHARQHELLSTELAALLTRVGRYLLCSGLSFSDARDLHEEALRMRRALQPGDQPETARCLVHLAVALNELGETHIARKLHEEALQMRRRLYPDDHPDLAHSLDNLGNVLHILNEYATAREHHEQGLEMRRRLYSGDHPNLAYSLSNLASDLHKLGHVEQCRTLNESALEMRRRLEPGDHPDTAHSLSRLADAHHGLGEYEAAIDLERQGLAMRQRLYPAGHPNVVKSLLSLAESHHMLGQEAVAQRFRDEARGVGRTWQATDLGVAERVSDNGRDKGAPRMIRRALFPGRLRHGDRVRVVSPSSTITDQRDTLQRAADALERSLGVTVEFAEHALGAYFYSSGTAEQRRDDLMAAFADPEVKAVLLSMGGATAIDMLEGLDYDLIAANPKIVAGMSDSSTLLEAITARTGLVTFYGFEMFDFARHEMSYTTESIRRTWFDGWSGPFTPNPQWRDLEGDPTSYLGWREIKPGQVTGPAAGGNSDAFAQLIGTRYCPRLDNAVLILETYRLQKRHLQALMVSLRLKGVLDQIAGMVLGYCLGSDQPSGRNERDVADILRETTAGYDFPIMQVGEIGHQVENLILPLGATVRMDTENLSFSLTTPAVSR